MWTVLGGVVVLALLAVTYVMTRSHAGGSTKPKITSLAVLPLKNLSGDASQEYLADGMTEALIGRLSNIHDLRVISRTSAMHFKDTQLSVPEIARALRVDALVEGSVIRDGSRIRVTAQLFAARPTSTVRDQSERGRSPWSEVAQSLLKSGGYGHGEQCARLSPSVMSRPRSGNHLKGQFVTYSNGLREVCLLEEATRKDPRSRPLIGLANAYADLGSILPEAPQMRFVLPQRSPKALELDPHPPKHVVWQKHMRQRGTGADARSEYKRFPA
jgi:TolB-like protein